MRCRLALSPMAAAPPFPHGPSQRMQACSGLYTQLPPAGASSVPHLNLPPCRHATCIALAAMRVCGMGEGAVRRGGREGAWDGALDGQPQPIKERLAASAAAPAAAADAVGGSGCACCLQLLLLAAAWSSSCSSYSSVWSSSPSPCAASASHSWPSLRPLTCARTHARTRLPAHKTQAHVELVTAQLCVASPGACPRPTLQVRPHRPRTSNVDACAARPAVPCMYTRHAQARLAVCACVAVPVQ